MKKDFHPYLVAVLIFASSVWAPEARPQYSVAGWYGTGSPGGIVGPADSPTAACEAVLPEALLDGIAAGFPPEFQIASFNSLTDNNSCMWNNVTNDGVFGPQDQAIFFTSAYYPLPPFSPPINLGQPKDCSNLESNPCNPAIGNKFQTESDYVGAGPFPLKFVRYYNSLGNEGNTAGIGTSWTHTYSGRLLRDDVNVVAIRADGKSLRFTLVGGTYVSDATASERLERITSPALGWKLTTAADEVELYDDPGKLISIADRTGRTQTLAYDANGRLASVTDPFGRTLALARDSFSHIQSVTTPGGGVFTYGSDAFRNLAMVTYPDATARNYLYENTEFGNNLTGIVDENGQRFSTYTYDDSTGLVVATEHAGGVEKVTIVNSMSTDVRDVTVTRFVDANQSVSRTYSYTSVVGVASKTAVQGLPCPSCGDLARTYDANGNVASRTDWNGNVTNNSYDLTRNLETSRTEAFGSPQARTITTSWHPTFHLPTQINEPGRTTNLSYDASGNLLTKSITDTASSKIRTFTYTYNSNGQVLTMNGPRTDVNDVTTYTYYLNNDPNLGKRGNIATITNALGQVTNITAYNAHGQPLTIVDPNGLTTQLSYDARLRLTSRNVGGETTTYTYDGVGQLTQVVLPDGSSLTYTYDAAHRLTQIADNLGNKIVYTLDLMGNRTQEQVFDPTNNLAQTRSRVYSSLNRLAQDIGAQNQTTQYAYDNQGNLTQTTDPLNHITGNAYDALNRLIRVTDPNNGVTQYGYDTFDHLTQVTDPRTLATSYGYDGLDNLNQVDGPDTGTTQNTYDNAGNLLTQRDAKGQLTTYVYDALNRVTHIAYADGQTIAYSYDQGTNGIGRLTRITDSTDLINYAYDQKGRLLTETRVINNIHYITAYAYDSAGRLSGMTYPSGRHVTYTRDSLGRIAQVSTTPAGGSIQSVASSIAYQPFGGVKSYTLGNGQVYTRGYDLDGRIASYSLANQSFAIGYDAASRIVFLSDNANPANANTYGYDALDRLTSAVLPNVPFAYSYDAVGNRLSQTVGTVTSNYTYSVSSNRLSSISVFGVNRSFSFDANGSTTNDSLHQYVYDARGRLVRAVGLLGTTTYQVNALGQRVRKTNRTEDRVYLYDVKGRLIAEATPAGAITREYLYLNDIALAAVSASNVSYVHVDHLNTPRLIANQAGTTVWRWDQTEPFGLIPPNGLGNFTFNPRFPGQYFDKETNLAYNYFRDYDPGIGRYVVSDPIGLQGGINTYGYVGGNPLSYTDPDGLQAAPAPGLPIPLPPVFIPGTPANQAFVGSVNQLIKKIKELCESDDSQDCQKASRWQLTAAGITNEHEFKQDYVGRQGVSRYDVCACKDGSVVIKQVGMCGKSGPSIPTSNRWK